jgi:transposase-like protein
MSSLLSLFKKFPTQESCIEHLENIRWKNGVVCPYCQSHKISQHNEEGRRKRHQCQTCTKSFSVTVGTIFHNTHLDLRNWFYILSLMINAKKGLSACQVARDLEMRRTTAWEVMHKIRKAFATEQKELLTGIFEMDETYIKADKTKMTKTTQQAELNL